MSCLACLFHILCRMRLDSLDTDLIQFLYEKLSVFSIHNGLNRSSKYLDIIFFQHFVFIKCHTAVERSLTTERKKNSLRTLFRDNFLHKERSNRQEVNLVCHTFGGLNSSNVRVYEDSLNSLLTQRLEGLRT